MSATEIKASCEHLEFVARRLPDCAADRLLAEVRQRRRALNTAEVLLSEAESDLESACDAAEATIKDTWTEEQIAVASQAVDFPRASLAPAGRFPRRATHSPAAQLWEHKDR